MELTAIMNSYTQAITIRQILLSPGHNYFGRPKDGPGPHPTRDVEQAELVADHGILGDRYYGVAAHYDAQITFLAWEVFIELQTAFDRPDWTPLLMRRNVVVEGMPLNALLGQEFELDCGEGRVLLAGMRECSPCAWMDAMLAPGVQKWLRGRGGLRTRILSDGVLRKGPAQVYSGVPLDLAQVTLPAARPKLP